MKKLFLMALLFSAVSLNAQVADSTAANSTAANVAEVSESEVQNKFKADEGSIMAEIGFAPLLSNAVSLNGGMLRGIYVVSEKVELKLGLGFGLSKDVVDNGEEGDEWERNSERVSRFSIAPGFNYTFKGTEKLCPYVGAEVSFALTSNKVYEETNTSSSTLKNENCYNTFGVSGQLGFNYYFVKNLFIGAEIGIGVAAHFERDVKTESENGNSSSSDVIDSDHHQVDFAPLVTPSLRLGWVFN